MEEDGDGDDESVVCHFCLRCAELKSGIMKDVCGMMMMMMRDGVRYICSLLRLLKGEIIKKFDFGLR